MCVRSELDALKLKNAKLEEQNKTLSTANADLKQTVIGLNTHRCQTQQKLDDVNTLLETLQEESFNEITGLNAVNRRLNDKFNRIEDFKLPFTIDKKDLFDVNNWNDKFSDEQIDFLKDTFIVGLKQSEELIDVAKYVVSEFKNRHPGLKYRFNIKPKEISQICLVTAVKKLSFNFYREDIEYMAGLVQITQ